MDTKFMILKEIYFRGRSAPHPRARYMYILHDIQRSSLKPFGQSKPNVLGRENESLYKWSRSHDQDGRHGYLACSIRERSSTKSWADPEGGGNGGPDPPPPGI